MKWENVPLLVGLLLILWIAGIFLGTLFGILAGVVAIFVGFPMPELVFVLTGILVSSGIFSVCCSYVISFSFRQGS